MTDTTENAPVKRTSRLRPTPPAETEPDTDTQAAAATPSTIAAPEPAEPEPLPTAVPAPLPAVAPPAVLGAAAPSPFKRHDVVQILDTTSRNYGGFFVVGDVLRDQVHGYLMAEGRKKEFVTVRIPNCWYIGTAKVRSQNPCSPKWIADNRPPA